MARKKWTQGDYERIARLRESGMKLNDIAAVESISQPMVRWVLGQKSKFPEAIPVSRSAPRKKVVVSEPDGFFKHDSYYRF
jgi:hypothetical protein